MRKKIYIALDYSDADAALAMVHTLAPICDGFKIGTELFYSSPNVLHDVRRLLGSMRRDGDIFLDLKLHDIPTTVGKTVSRLVRQFSPSSLTVHALGGEDMLMAAAENACATDIIAVTILTSIDESNSPKVFASSISDTVHQLASLAERTGLSGVVCSRSEIISVKAIDENFKTYVPGVRLKKSSDCQMRVTTPLAAVAAGADVLIIGREVTKSDYPFMTLLEIINSIEGV